MADTKVSALTTVAPLDADVLYVSKAAGGPLDRNATALGLKTYIVTRDVLTKTADYTLILTDNGKWVEANKASAISITVPANASVAFPVGTVIRVVQIGAGATTVVAGGGVTISPIATKTLVLEGQFGVATLYKRATDTWIISGDLTLA